MTDNTHDATAVLDHHRKTYFMIFGWLVVLTVLEVGVTMVHSITGGLQVFLLVAMAAVKAGLVGAYFMHLKYEQVKLIALVFVPVILAGLLVIGLMPDSAGWGLK